MTKVFHEHNQLVLYRGLSHCVNSEFEFNKDFGLSLDAGPIPVMCVALLVVCRVAPIAEQNRRVWG